MDRESGKCLRQKNRIIERKLKIKIELINNKEENLGKGDCQGERHSEKLYREKHC